MTGKSLKRMRDDAELLTWWREWLKALDAEMSAVDEREEQRRHKRVELIQRSIAKTPSQGLVGIGIKLALANFLDGFCDDAGGETAVSAYFDTRQMLGRDFLAEAEAIIERVRQRDRSSRNTADGNAEMMLTALAGTASLSSVQRKDQRSGKIQGGDPTGSGSRSAARPS